MAKGKSAHRKRKARPRKEPPTIYTSLKEFAKTSEKSTALESESAREIPAMLIGRNEELRRLTNHFASEGRTASINGLRGSGKTMLARAFTCNARSFPGGIWYLSTVSPFAFHMFLEEKNDFNGLMERSLLVIDDFHVRGPGVDRWIVNALSAQPLLNMLFVGEDPFSPHGVRHLDVPLGGLTNAEFSEIVTQRGVYADLDKANIAKLWALAAGNPLFADLAGMTIRDGIVTVKKLLEGLRNFDYPGILGPDGQPIREDIVPQQIRLEVSETNAEILARLQSDPASLRLLGPRKFEEIIADLLAQQGYSVELTPSSSDGGFDMYVAKKEGLGTFLYLVECKRYTPPKKVGVEIVRGLHGVVQEKQANAGIIVTSSFFTKGAQEFQQRIPYQLHLHDYIVIQKWLGII